MINNLYQLCGEIFEAAQYIEWNIALIVSHSRNSDAANMFEDMQNMTMGQIIGCAKKTEYFEDSDLKELEYILSKRNYLAHQFFKKNDIVKHNSNVPFLENKVGELQNILLRFQNFNNELSEFDKTIRESSGK